MREALVGRMPRWRSMRLRVLAVVLVVVAGPSVFVWLSNLTDTTVDRRIRADLADAINRTSEVLRRLPPDAWADAIDEIAWDREVRVQVVDRGGRLVIAQNREETEALNRWFGAWFFGPGGPPTLEAWDEGRPELTERPEFRTTLDTGSWFGCERADEGRLLVCQALQVVEVGPVENIVVVQQSSRRAIRALYDQRWLILQLTLFTTLPLGLFLAWWLGWRVVRPLELLREQVLERRAAPHRYDPVQLDRSDEYGELAVAFNELMRTLSDRNRAYEAFVADLAHELKNPVAAVRAAAESMSVTEGELNEARKQRLARVLADSSTRLDALVSRFLELARAEAGLPDQERSRVDLGELVHGLVRTVREDPRFAGLSWHVQTRATSVDGVPERLETALRNLLENAGSFAGQGGSVWVDVSTVDGFAVAAVTDSGPGIPEELQARVFDRFFTRRADDRGTGLGLALVRAIVEAHGGHISADNAVGRGARLTLRIPVERDGRQ